MSETLAQHPPAVKVGGRRLSTTTRPKPHMTAEPKPPSPPPAEERPDYPRPAAPGEPQAHDPQHVHDDHDELPKKEKKQGFGSLEHERKAENLYMKQEQNRPTRDLMNTGKNTGGKIIQPAGKGIGV